MSKLKIVFAVLLLLSSTIVVNADTMTVKNTGNLMDYVIPMEIEYIEIIEVGNGYEIIQITKGNGIDDFAFYATYNIGGSIRYDIGLMDIDTGLLWITHNPYIAPKTKLLIQNSTTGEKYYYNVFSGTEANAYPLQFGDGKYEVKLYEHTTGSSYKKVYSKVFDVKLDNPLDVFLASILEINWYVEDEAIILTESLLDGLRKQLYIADKKLTTDRYVIISDYEDYYLTDDQIISVCYEYVIKNIAYDYEKIETLQYNYIPDIDETLKDKTGICYDYSVLLASMLRSQGVPAKLIKGYTTNTDVYHAWNEIYLEDEERWAVVDTTFDAYYKQNRMTYSFEKEAEEYVGSIYY
ncbi:MAG: transglutaminase-like domain-containing protein [Vallitaleaceae bacterium]|jgi:hypothetical protein|nr:transglutaminase-like domain-containing protein [Vallitaleaceae bacterium]